MMKLTIGNLCDQLITVNIKMYMLENVKRDNLATDEIIAEATRKTNSLNEQRNNLIEEIDLAMNEIAMGERQQLFGANKMYGND